MQDLVKIYLLFVNVDVFLGCQLCKLLSMKVPMELRLFFKTRLQESVHLRAKKLK